LLLSGCRNVNSNADIVGKFTCDFSNGDTTGTVSCTQDTVTISNIKVCGEDVGIVLSVTADRYTVATANAKAEYLFESAVPFPLAEFGHIILNAANNQTLDNIEVSKKGLITSVTTENGTTYTLHSHNKT